MSAAALPLNRYPTPPVAGTIRAAGLAGAVQTHRLFASFGDVRRSSIEVRETALVHGPFRSVALGSAYLLPFTL